MNEIKKAVISVITVHVDFIKFLANIYKCIYTTIHDK